MTVTPHLIGFPASDVMAQLERCSVILVAAVFLHLVGVSRAYFEQHQQQQYFKNNSKREYRKLIC